MTQKKSSNSTSKTKPDLDSPSTAIPKEAREALGRCSRHLSQNFSGISDPTATLRYVVLRDMGNLMPLLMRCSSSIASSNRLELSRDEWASVEEQLGAFVSNWLDAWRGHVHDVGNWRRMFTDICHNGVCGSDDEQKAWLIMADAVLRMMVLAPVYIDTLGSQAFEDIREETAKRAITAVTLAGLHQPIRRTVIENLVTENQLSVSDPLGRVATTATETPIRFGRLRRCLTNLLRKMAARLSGRKSLAVRLQRLKEHQKYRFADYRDTVDKADTSTKKEEKT